MSRVSSELASSLLVNLGKGTTEPQIPAAGWKDVPRMKGELKGFTPHLSITGFPRTEKRDWGYTKWCDGSKSSSPRSVGFC